MSGEHSTGGPSGFNPFEQPDAGGGPDQHEVLARLSRRTLDGALDRSLDDLGELLDRIEEREAAAGEDGVPAELVPVLEELTGAEEAPLTYRSLRRRVREGFTSWDAFWRAPHEEADGMRLLREAMQVCRDRLTDLPDPPRH